MCAPIGALLLTASKLLAFSGGSKVGSWLAFKRARHFVDICCVIGAISNPTSDDVAFHINFTELAVN